MCVSVQYGQWLKKGVLLKVVPELLHGSLQICTQPSIWEKQYGCHMELEREMRSYSNLIEFTVMVL